MLGRLRATRLGRRGCVLLFFAYIGFIYGLSLFSPQASTPSVRFLASLLPLSFWGWTWVAMGLVCLAQAFMRMDRFAFTYVVAVMASWSLLFLAGWLMGALPRGWLTASFFLPFAGLAMVASGWPEKPITLTLSPAPATPDLPSYPNAIITADEYGRILSWGGAAERMFGRTADDIIGQPIRVLMPERYRDAHEAGLRRVRQTGESALAGKAVRVHALDAGGSEFPIELMVAILGTDHGSKFSAVIRDLREPP